VREIGKGAFGTVFLVKHKGESGDVEPLARAYTRPLFGST
jgi:hypothetical protein